jgi:hypothetical protein
MHSKDTEAAVLESLRSSLADLESVHLINREDPQLCKLKADIRRQVITLKRRSKAQQADNSTPSKRKQFLTRSRYLIRLSRDLISSAKVRTSAIHQTRRSESREPERGGPLPTNNQEIRELALEMKANTRRVRLELGRRSVKSRMRRPT